MPQTGKIPATVITGFLGAGKSTLIRHLLETANGRRLALIINEFGDIGVDRELLRGCGDETCRDEDIVELTNGCICCTVADDFVPTMEALLNRAEPPDHIIIETSGLALPKPLVRAFNWPEIRTRVTVDGVIAVVDGAAVADGRFADDHDLLNAQRMADPNLDHESPMEELFEEQVQCADLVILNKAELIPDGLRKKVEDDVARHLRTAVRVVPSSFGRIDAAVLLGLGAAAEDDLDSRPSHHDTEGEDEHDHHHDDFVTFDVHFGEIPSPEHLMKTLAPVIAEHDILRIKGFVAVAGKPMRLILQGVGARLQHYYDRDWAGNEARKSCLVVIGQQGLDTAAIRTAIEGR
ncbi:MAG: cobalamin biosynthesis protein CobW [Rhodospirillales bacterium]|nr:cobalamin biosynthesis protein CobW [Rhodospirillales bacterium]